MDIVFDIDGTLADATHRIHFIKDMAHWTSPEGKLPRPNWEAFLASDQIARDSAIPQTWKVLRSLLADGNRIVFITGRPERERETTYNWLTDLSCPIRAPAVLEMDFRSQWPVIFMRKDGDRRASSAVKLEGLQAAHAEGYRPKLVFEDRADDTAMWRRNGLLCCQVADGDY